MEERIDELYELAKRVHEETSAYIHLDLWGVGPLLTIQISSNGFRGSDYNHYIIMGEQLLEEEDRKAAQDAKDHMLRILGERF